MDNKDDTKTPVNLKSKIKGYCEILLIDQLPNHAYIRTEDFGEDNLIVSRGKEVLDRACVN